MRAKKVDISYRLVAGAVAGFAALVVLLATGVIALSDSQSITRKVIDVPFEKALVEYCGVLERVDGVLEVSYDEYDPISHTAYVTVKYDPDMTSPKILMVYFGHTKAIWTSPVVA